MVHGLISIIRINRSICGRYEFAPVAILLCPLEVEMLAPFNGLRLDAKEDRYSHLQGRRTGAVNSGLVFRPLIDWWLILECPAGCSSSVFH